MHNGSRLPAGPAGASLVLLHVLRRRERVAGREAPIARRSLHDEVVSRVRDMIVDGRLPPGERIVELDLCEKLGISRTPLREALKVLASEGLVDLLPSRGAVVRVLTRKNVHDMLTLMAVLEEYGGRLACTAASDETIAEISALHARMMNHYRRGQRTPYFQLNQQIHDAIVRAAGNATLVMVHTLLKVGMRRVRYAGSQGEKNWRAAVGEHERMIAALEARDADKLGAALREHLLNALARVEASLPDEVVQSKDGAPISR